jgi:hypothetical protein
VVDFRDEHTGEMLTLLVVMLFVSFLLLFPLWMKGVPVA